MGTQTEFENGSVYFLDAEYEIERLGISIPSPVFITLQKAIKLETETYERRESQILGSSRIPRPRLVQFIGSIPRPKQY